MMFVCVCVCVHVCVHVCVRACLRVRHSVALKSGLPHYLHNRERPFQQR